MVCFRYLEHKDEGIKLEKHPSWTLPPGQASANSREPSGMLKLNGICPSSGRWQQLDCECESLNYLHSCESYTRSVLASSEGHVAQFCA